MNYQIKRTKEFSQKIKGSKFIGRAYPVESRESARSIIKVVEDEHRKATHVCWAYRILQKGESLGYCSDAGEPHGSAGPPILAAIEGRQLVNTLCVVIRYFGGTKLGIGGLIRAYGGTAAEVLEQAEKKSFIGTINLAIQVSINDYSDLMRILRKYRLSVQPEFSSESVTIKIQTTPGDLDRLQNDVRSISSAILKNE
ncbi:MAG: YigZ family protein [Candidatus Marinimicrobia bacterium]|nr:YigZ family protein [Candidatus Neomarinimicrobiota bacterium]